MKSKFFFAIAILIFVGGLAVIGYVKAVPGAKGGDNAPVIEITPDSYDFGEIQYKDIVTRGFKVRNKGNAVLEITRVATSCGCTTAKVTKTTLEPGEETELEVVYNSGQMTGSHGKGQQERIIYIKSNDPINPQIEALIYGTVN